jgi:hypothetical protein
MTLEEMIAAFELHENNMNLLAEWRAMPNKRSNRRDLHAFLLLDSLVPCEKGMDIVSASEHDQIFLYTDPEKLAAVVTDEIVLELVRSGVCYDERIDSLYMLT